MQPQFLLLSTAAIAHLFVLWTHSGKMLSAEHYQFFPLGILGVVILWNQRSAEIREKSTPPSNIVTAVALSFSLLFAVVSTLLSSGFLGWLATLYYLLVFAYSCFGWGGLKACLPVWFLLAALTPIPAGREQQLVVAMQYLASNLASMGLDVLGVLHLRQGVVLVSATQQFLAEEACSGIRSLFSTLVGILFWGLIHRYAWWRHMVNLVQALFWVLVFNAGRILLVVLVEDWTSFSIASGWKHDLLGFITFFVIGGTVLSTDALIRAFVPLRNSEGDELPNASISKSTTTPAATPAFEFPNWLPSQRQLGMVFSLLFAVVGLLSLRMFTLAPATATISSSLTGLTQGALPATINGWEVVSFQEVKRSREDLQGNQSFIWKLNRNGDEASVSSDGDFTDYHDLRVCYGALGWKQLDKPMYPDLKTKVAGGDLSNFPEYTQLYLEKLTGEKGMVFFCSLDRTGASVFPQNYWANEPALYAKDKMVNQLREAIGLSTASGIRDSTFVPPVSTLQLIYVPKDSSKMVDEKELKELFLEFRRVLRESPRFNDGKVK